MGNVGLKVSAQITSRPPGLTFRAVTGGATASTCKSALWVLTFLMQSGL